MFLYYEDKIGDFKMAECEPKILNQAKIAIFETLEDYIDRINVCPTLEEIIPILDELGQKVGKDLMKQAVRAIKKKREDDLLKLVDLDEYLKEEMK